MPPHPISCPRCSHRFTAALEASLSLPPTGGDYDWCEGRESHHCPQCRALLGVLVRVWLDDRRVEVVDTEVLPPPPVPGVPYSLGVSPGGGDLVGHDGQRFWRWRAEAGGWRAPELLSASPAARRERGCPAMAFSADGRLLLATGELFEPELRPAGALELPDASLVGLGWLAGRPAVVWRRLPSRPHPRSSLLTQHYWQEGIRRYLNAGSFEEHQHEPHSGIVMSGRYLFDDRGDRLYRLAPPTHGASSLAVERLRLDADALFVEATCSLATSASCCRLDGDALLVGEERTGVWRLDPATLSAAAPLRLPASLFEDFTSLQDVLALGDDCLLLCLSNAVARVRAVGDEAQLEHRFDLQRVRAVASGAGQVFVATDWELLEVRRDDDTRPLPLPTPAF